MNIPFILANVILPVFLIISLGALTGRRLELDSKTLSRAALYIFGPALAFRSLYQTELSSRDATQIVAFVLISAATFGIVAWGLTRVFHFDPVQSNAFLLTTLIFNTGNYGLPVSLFAFGEAGLERAVLYFATSAVLTYTVGIYLASRGRAAPREAFLNVFRVPQIYAILLAFGLRLADITTLPPPLSRPIDLLAEASIPVLLLVLGIELAKIEIDRQIWTVGLATVMRLVVAAGIAGLLATLMGLQGLTRQVCILQASMPTAVTSVVLAVEFDTNPRFVTSVVFISTLGSLVTLTLLLSLLA